MAIHLACIGTGFAALLAYYFRCRDIKLGLAALVAATHDRLSGWNPVQTNEGDQLHQYLTALPGLLWGWALGPVAVALLCWTYQRLLYNAMVRGWRAATARNEVRDAMSGLVIAGLDPTVRSRRVLLELRKQAYTEVVRPLEPYIVVIFMFAIPQTVGVTQTCQRQTQATFVAGYSGDADAELPCENIVQFVLSFRAVALVIVYLWDRKVRAEALDIPELCRRLCRRRTGGGGGVRFPDTELDEVALVPTEGVGRSTSFGKADTDIKRMGSMASKRLAEMSTMSAGDGQDIPAPADSQIPYQRMD